MVHKIMKLRKIKFGRGIHKYDIQKEIEKTKVAYADSFITGKSTPKEEKIAYQTRNLKWKGTSYMTPEDWLKVARIAGVYNQFEPENVYSILKKFPKSRIKLGRESSVVIYIKSEGYNPQRIMRELKKTGEADEVGLVKKAPAPFVKQEGGKIIRSWWD